MTYTTVRVSEATLERLKKQGSKGDSYDDIIRRLLELAEKEDK